MYALDSAVGPRPSLRSASATSFGRPGLRGLSVGDHIGRTRSNTGPTGSTTQKQSLKNIIDAGIEPSPWHKASPYCLRQVSFLETVRKAEEKDRQEKRRQREVTRQLDGSQSGSSSPGTSRASSLISSAIQRDGTANSDVSDLSAKSKASRRSYLNRVLSPNDDRDTQGHEARQERQLREHGVGTDCDSDTTSNRGQGQRGFFGKYKGKGARYVLCPPQTCTPGLNGRADFGQRTPERSTGRIGVST